MANQQIRAQQLFRYRNFHINKSQLLGHGSYGAVYKAKCDQLSCAAKILHPTILDPNDPGASKVMQRFKQECAFLENIRHPNIVQYLGMTRDPESRLPVLLMELLDESLTKVLEHSKRSLAYYVQVDICHDIALAVAYLHSNDIIHRDLSSNNVLIMAKGRAKVTDFGMSKLAGTAPSMTPLTMCPGTVAYMPPEALDEPPVYTKKLDCFSEGVIMIQVCTRQWPEPGPRTKAVAFPASPTGVTLMPVPEPERRKHHIDMIDHGHGLLPISMDCLHYQENERPSSEELCQRLAGLKETREYRESVEQVERVQNDIVELERQMGEMQVQEAATAQLLHKLRDENQRQKWRYQSEIQLKDRQIQKYKQQFEEQEKITADIKQTNISLQKQMQQLSQQTRRPPPPPPVSREVRVSTRRLQHDLLKRSQPSLRRHQKPQPPKRQLILRKWSDGGSASYRMTRGAAVVDRNVAYFLNWNGQACAYDSSTQSWSKLPQSPCTCSSFTAIRGIPTTIGGEKERNSENKLYSLLNHQDEWWVEHFPPMPTKRSHTAAVTTNQHLIVVGGMSGSDQLKTVEVMDIYTLVWSTAASLPLSCSCASATICGDQLFMLGGLGWAGIKTKLVSTCLLAKLLPTCSLTSSDSVWHATADIPVYVSTCASINGELVAVGGEDTDEETTSIVYKYKSSTDSWDFIGNMPTARYQSLVAVLPTNEIMVVGGYSGAGGISDKVEIASIINGHRQGIIEPHYYGL